MKKHLLISSLAITISGFSLAQDFTQAANNTGFTYNCDLDESSNTNPPYTWSTWFPDCSYSGGTGSGGIDATNVDQLSLGFGQGSQGLAYFIFTLTTPLDLSNNAKVSMTLGNVDGNGNALSVIYSIHLEDAAGATLTDAIDVNVIGSPQSFSLDFSNMIKSGEDLSSVGKIVFVYSSCSAGAIQAASKLLLSNFMAGSSVTGVKAAQQLIANAKLFPNPATDVVNVAIDLKSSSSISLVLSDIMGKEIKVLTEGTFTNLNYAFTTSELIKGMYTLTYVINGVPAKTDLFMVK